MLSWITESGADTRAARSCHMSALRLQEGGPPSYFRPRPVSSADTYAKWSAAPPVPDRDEMMTSCETPYFSGVGPQPGISRGLFDGMKYRAGRWEFLAQPHVVSRIAKVLDCGAASCGSRSRTQLTGKQAGTCVVGWNERD